MAPFWIPRATWPAPTVEFEMSALYAMGHWPRLAEALANSTTFLAGSKNIFWVTPQ